MVNALIRDSLYYRLYKFNVFDIYLYKFIFHQNGTKMKNINVENCEYRTRNNPFRVWYKPKHVSNDNCQQHYKYTVKQFPFMFV